MLLLILSNLLLLGVFGDLEVFLFLFLFLFFSLLFCFFSVSDFLLFSLSLLLFKGTCLNVGCIPKKLMHTGALMGEGIKSSEAFGWKVEGEVKHDWNVLVENVSDYIGSQNFGLIFYSMGKNSPNSLSSNFTLFSFFFFPQKKKVIDLNV